MSLKILEKSPTLQISVYQTERENGLGDAMKNMCRRTLTVFQETPSPNSSTRQLIDVYNKYNASAISLEEVPMDKVERYGIIKGSEVEKNIYKISELVEKPPRDNAPSNLAIMGRYVLTPDIFDKIDETEPGVGGEIQLTDALQKLDSIYGVTFKGKTYDIANRLEWLKTSIEFALDDKEFRDDLVEYMKNYI